MNKSDHELIADFVDGQTAAFGALVVRYQGRLLSSLTGVLGSVEDASDVAQEAFLLAFQNLASFRGNSAFYSWLFRIALNAAATRQRRRKKPCVSIEATREATGEEPLETHPDSQPDAALNAEERRMLVQKALGELSEEFRVVLVLKEMEGLKYEQIAEIVDCPVGTVRSRIHRGRIELRERLSVLFKGVPDV